ncbi:MAG: AtpZ/AtpI family protein [Oscillospiraceae bacterium]|nr:AtpZ/AtpI family protein [Oscillospiraceae bacterium]
MKILNLLMWVGQFGFSVIFPTLFFLILAVWLQQKFSLGMWIILVFGILGVLTSISTTRSCLHSLRKAAEEASGSTTAPVSFNDHS